MHNEGNYQQNKRLPTEWEDILTDACDKGVITKFIKYLQNSIPKIQTTQLKMGQGPE